MLSLQKNEFFSLFSLPDFSFENSKPRWLFFELGGDELTKANVRWGGIFETNRKEQGSKGDQKSAVLSERTFWMTPLCEHAK